MFKKQKEKESKQDKEKVDEVWKKKSFLRSQCEIAVKKMSAKWVLNELES